MPAHVHDRLGRLLPVAPTLVMGAVGAALSWTIAMHAVGRQGAFFAPVATVIALGLTAGQRVERALELAIGVPLGIALADILVLWLGDGPWQLAAIVLLATSLAVMIGGGPMLVTQSAVSAILVVTLQPPTHGLSFTRAIDALIGCAVALVLNYVIAPIDPLALARREVRPVLEELRAVLDGIADALEQGRRDLALAALLRARDIDAHLATFTAAMQVARETAQAAPQRRRARAPVAAFSDAATQIDLAVRNVRVLARGALRALDVEHGVPPAVPEAIRDLGRSVGEVLPWLDSLAVAEQPLGRDAIVEAALHAAEQASAVLEQTTNLSVSVLVGQVRSTAVDLMRTTGMAPEEARALIRASA